MKTITQIKEAISHWSKEVDTVRLDFLGATQDQEKQEEIKVFVASIIDQLLETNKALSLGFSLNYAGLFTQLCALITQSTSSLTLDISQYTQNKKPMSLHHVQRLVGALEETGRPYVSLQLRQRDWVKHLPTLTDALIRITSTVLVIESLPAPHPEVLDPAQVKAYNRAQNIHRIRQAQLEGHTPAVVLSPVDWDEDYVSKMHQVLSQSEKSLSLDMRHCVWNDASEDLFSAWELTHPVVLLVDQDGNQKSITIDRDGIRQEVQISKEDSVYLDTTEYQQSLMNSTVYSIQAMEDPTYQVNVLEIACDHDSDTGEDYSDPFSDDASDSSYSERLLAMNDVVDMKLLSHSPPSSVYKPQSQGRERSFSVTRPLFPKFRWALIFLALVMLSYLCSAMFLPVGVLVGVVLAQNALVCLGIHLLLGVSSGLLFTGMIWCMGTCNTKGQGISPVPLKHAVDACELNVASAPLFAISEETEGMLSSQSTLNSSP